MSKLIINDLHVSAEGQKILKGVNLELETGKIYALIGPNGNGKSTLLSTIMGDPDYQITKGSISLDGVEIQNWEVDERARSGIFLGMQYPSEIAGVKNLDLIKTSVEAISGEPQSVLGVYADIKTKAGELRMSKELIEREVNVGFSGGEKKKNEIMQMLMLKPKFALLDEVDSGLDVDSINAISKLIENEVSNDRAFIIVSHYKKLYDSIKPDVVIVLKNGSVSQIGTDELLQKILIKGFDNA